MRFPNDTQRLVIVGTTGSGKTAAGVAFLSKQDFVTKPWVIYDFKRDPLLARIKALEGSYEITTNEVPDQPGLYFVHPHPDDTADVQNQLRMIWERKNIGVYIDEGYMVSTSPNKRSWFRTLLTQGRSMHIPMITLSQRPSFIDKFVFTEAEFFAVFRLNSVADKKKVNDYIPYDISETLPDYHFYYYDSGANKLSKVSPVKTDDEIIDVFYDLLEPLREEPAPVPRRVII